MGAALVRFDGVIDRDNAIRNSPYFIGETVMRVIDQSKGRNHRSATFTHDVWLMLLNFPLECWELNTIVKSMTPMGVSWSGIGMMQTNLELLSRSVHMTLIRSRAVWLSCRMIVRKVMGAPGHALVSS